MRLKKLSIPKLWKLDSFLKESQRFTPPQLRKLSSIPRESHLLTASLATSVRVATAPITLSTGHTLPSGTRFGFAAYAIQHSSLTPTFSPTFSSPSIKPVSEFDGFRFYNLRKIPGNENKHQFVTTSPDSLNFGHGNHACPGRFFASNEIKVVLMELLRCWEFRFLGDKRGEGGEKRRPENFWDEMTCTPNTKAEIEFRRKV